MHSFRLSCLWILVLLLAITPLACGEQPLAHGPWTPVGLCGGGGLGHPAICPQDTQTLLLETDMGSRFLSRDGGRFWRPIHHAEIGSSFRSCPPVFDPHTPGVVIATRGFQGRALYTSHDYGLTWTPWPEDRLPSDATIRRMVMDPDVPGRLILANREGEVFLTSDGGKTWTSARLPGGDVLYLVIDRTSPPDARQYFAATAEGVFRSEDGCKTFRKVGSKGLPGDLSLRAFCGASDAKTTMLYAVTPCRLDDGDLEGGVYVSADLGETWQRVMNQGINTQTERSSQWAGGDIPQYSHIRASNGDPMRAYVYCRGTSYFPPNHSTIYRTDNAGKSWREVFFVDPRFEQHNAEDDWMTTFRGTSWVSAPISMEISPTDPDVLMRTSSMFAYITYDGGDSWRAVHARPAGDVQDDRTLTWKNNGLVNTTTWHYYIDPHDASRHYIAYTDIGFARSFDGGVTWRWWGPGEKKLQPGEGRDMPVPRRWANTCYEIAFDPARPGRLWGAFSSLHDIPNENSVWRAVDPATHEGGICRSDDYGRTWNVVNAGLPEAPCLSVLLDDSTEPDTLFASFYGKGVYISRDGGKTWTSTPAQPGTQKNRRITRLVLHDDGTLFAMVTGLRQGANGPFLDDHSTGLWRSDDRGTTWLRLGPDVLYPKDFGVDPADSDILFVGACDAPDEEGTRNEGGLYRSTDGGKTWNRVLRKSGTHFGATVHPDRKGWVYATCTGWSAKPEGGLFLSKDSGETWQAFSYLPFASIHRVAFDADHPDTIRVTTFGGSVWKGPAEPVRPTRK